MSLQIHPDRVAENYKEEATEKFKILTKIHDVLIDTNKKKLYDQQGIINDDSDIKTESSWLNLWRECSKVNDMEEKPQNYIGKFY